MQKWEYLSLIIRFDGGRYLIEYENNERVFEYGGLLKGDSYPMYHEYINELGNKVGNWLHQMGDFKFSNAPLRTNSSPISGVMISPKIA